MFWGILNSKMRNIAIFGEDSDDILEKIIITWRVGLYIMLLSIKSVSFCLITINNTNIDNKLLSKLQNLI